MCSSEWLPSLYPAAEQLGEDNRWGRVEYGKVSTRELPGAPAQLKCFSSSSILE